MHFIVTFEAAAKLNALYSFYTEVLVKPFHIMFDVSGVNVSILVEEKFRTFLLIVSTQTAGSYEQLVNSPECEFSARLRPLDWRLVFRLACILEPGY